AASAARPQAPQVLEEPERGLLDEIEHELEAVAAAVVRIGHVLAPEVRRELEQQANLAVVLGRAEVEERGLVQLVHREQEVEPLEVLEGDSPRAQRAEIDPAPLGRAPRAWVRRLADVVGVRAGRIDLDPKLRRALGDDLAEDA